MKSASMPSLRVDPLLRHAVEKVLRDDESLSSFMEQAVREQVARRQHQQEFIARGLASRDAAEASGEYFDAAVVHDELRQILGGKRTADQTAECVGACAIPGRRGKI